MGSVYIHKKTLFYIEKRQILYPHFSSKFSQIFYILEWIQVTLLLESLWQNPEDIIRYCYHIFLDTFRRFGGTTGSCKKKHVAWTEARRWKARLTWKTFWEVLEIRREKESVCWSEGYNWGDEEVENSSKEIIHLLRNHPVKMTDNNKLPTRQWENKGKRDWSSGFILSHVCISTGVASFFSLFHF